MTEAVKEPSGARRNTASWLVWYICPAKGTPRGEIEMTHQYRVSDVSLLRVPLAVLFACIYKGVATFERRTRSGHGGSAIASPCFIFYKRRSFDRRL